jgi:hypothetical protein
MEHVQIRLSSEEKKYLEREAEARGVDIMKYCSMILVGCDRSEDISPQSRIRFCGRIQIALSVLRDYTRLKKYGEAEGQPLKKALIDLYVLTSKGSKTEHQEKPLRGQQDALVYVDMDSAILERLEADAVRENRSRNDHLRRRLMDGKLPDILPGINEGVNQALKQLAKDLRGGHCDLKLWTEAVDMWVNAGK